MPREPELQQKNHLRMQVVSLESGGDLLSRAVSSQVPSALKGLTSVFGMGTGGTPSPLPPEISFQGSVPFSVLRFLPLGSPLPPASVSLRTLTTAQTLGLLPYARLVSVFLKSSPRPISISKLPCYHAYTADLSPGSLPGVLLVYNDGSSYLKVGFTLRCLQRLSHPHFASLLCPWQNNSCTSGASIPVLSY